MKIFDLTEAETQKSITRADYGSKIIVIKQPSNDNQ
jgi:hypothetical protein